ncbi:MAG TPA: DUF5695 domain-containing protein [Clostridia bacterium]|nr:DUF5695 domain-containing protein [Clostridia bacterium]
MNARRSVLGAAFVLLLLVTVADSSQVAQHTIQKGDIRFAYDDRGVSALAHPNDPYGAAVTIPERYLGLTVRYSVGGGEWKDLDVQHFRSDASPQAGVVRYTTLPGTPLKVVQTFKTDGKALDWNIDVHAVGNSAVRVGDVAIEVPVKRPSGEEPKEIFERGFLGHQFISGDGSFLYFVRASGAPPFLIVTPHPGTRLEYFDTAQRRTRYYIHSGLSGGNEQRGTWRQAHTFLELRPSGAKNSTAHYGFRFRWAKSYDELREILYDEGLFDIRAMPGMSIPEDLSARISLHTKARIESIEAEFPQQTKITSLGERLPGHHLYEFSFKRLGENKLTIHHDGGRKTYLEYFVTEPIETLIKKRSAFLIGRQQIRDGSKWWNGVFAPYDMKNKVLRTPEDPDIFKGRMSYVLTCDDPGLSKAPYIAAKNVAYPDQGEIEALEYYLEHFVWGKLQRTGEETPYPYGVYGTPDWYTNRDPERRAKISKTNLDKVHVWRSYDYPHIVMLYYHMYEIAKKYPHMSKYLDAAGYLQRAYQTARAFYTYPYELMPDYYETSKWGLYNELIVLKLAAALEREGFSGQASWLGSEWEKKVKYFVYDDPYPFRSEYAFDRTAFESSYALAKYGATHDMKADKNLWWDIKLKKWYSHPVVSTQDSRAFMDRQLASGLSVRGWLEASYYQLGADPGLSYMAAMGGWGILDYALNFSPQPNDWVQLGYASYLSSWSLMNTGRSDTNYGFWFPGKENDGAAGWQFMSAKHGNAWMGADVPRGPWHYDGEIDLGFAGALRMASTVLTHDPVFGWTAYGAELSEKGETFTIMPRDGLRQRFAAVLPDAKLPFAGVRRFKLEVDRDGFSATQPMITDRKFDKLLFTLDNRTQDAHSTLIRVSFPPGEHYELTQDGQKVSLKATGDWDYPWEAEVKMGTGASEINFFRSTQQ